MEYVSAEWVEGSEGRVIKATGDDGRVYWVPSISTDVPPWPQFLETEAGKAFKAASESGTS